MESERPDQASDVAMLIDWENLKFSLAQRGQLPNVAALRSAGERFGRIVYARAYADWQDANHRDEATGLYMAGLEPVYVPTKRYHDEKGEVRVKDSVDVKLAADCIEASHQYPNIATFIIVSGDHGFLHVVNTLRPRGKKVVVVGVSWTTARQLTESADVVLYYDIDVDKPLSSPETDSQATSPASAAPRERAATPQKIAPQIAQTVDTVVVGLGGAEAATIDKRAVADALGHILSVVHEFREAGRDLSVSSLGQELQKRLAPAVYSQQVKGKLLPLVRALRAHGLINMASRDMQDFIYLPDEVLPAPEPRAPAEPRLDLTLPMWGDLSNDQRARVLRSIRSLEESRHLDFLTFKRIRQCVADTLGRDEWSVHNLTNSMIQFSVLRVTGNRRGTSETGSVYAFDTFALDPEHEDVRKLLP